jgi:hypothetical protein
MPQILIRQIFTLVLRFIGGQWILFDPTRLSDLSSLVKIAHGKDGSDVAVANLFGNASCTYMNIE